MADGKAGPPEGNQNASKGRPWTEAIRWALENYEGSSIKRGLALRQIALTLVGNAAEGQKDAWQEIGNRLDGKPVQAIEGPGDNGEFIGKLTIEYVKPEDTATSEA